MSVERQERLISKWAQRVRSPSDCRHQSGHADMTESGQLQTHASQQIGGQVATFVVWSGVAATERSVLSEPGSLIRERVAAQIREGLADRLAHRLGDRMWKILRGSDTLRRRSTRRTGAIHSSEPPDWLLEVRRGVVDRVALKDRPRPAAYDEAGDQFDGGRLR